MVGVVVGGVVVGGAEQFGVEAASPLTTALNNVEPGSRS